MIGVKNDTKEGTPACAYNFIGPKQNLMELSRFF